MRTRLAQLQTFLFGLIVVWFYGVGSLMSRAVTSVNTNPRPNESTHALVERVKASTHAALNFWVAVEFVGYLVIASSIVYIAYINRKASDSTPRR